MFCRERVAQLRDHEEEIRAAGVDLAAIGTGDIAYAQHFKADRGIDFPLMVDEDLQSYRVIGARHGSVGSMLSPQVLTGSLRVLRHGSRQGRTGKHPMLLGATHVIEPDGSVPYAWVNGDFSDDPPVAEVLAAVGVR